MSGMKLARKSGLPQTTISKLSLSKITPTLDMCVAIAKGLGVSPASVIKEAGLEDALDLPYDSLTYEIEREILLLPTSQREHALHIIRAIRDGTLTYGIERKQDG
jgi:transcriptional regulator with XRE-family HTH domain